MTVSEIYEYCRSLFMTLWDGKWFIRAYTTKGEKYGTDSDEWNKIFLNPQSWSILSRLPDRKTADTAADSVMKYLYTEMGLMAHYPASSGFDWDNKSYFLYTSGARENGGIFFHSNTWAVIAFCLLKRGNDAWKIYSSSLPGRRNDIADICLTEPYVYSQTMLAKPHDRASACSNSWLTGTASWMYTSVTQYILGIRPEHKGFLIDPCIPDCWSGFSVKRICRGTVCDITVQRGEKVGVSVNGKPIQGQIVPWELFGHTDLKIQCVIGGKKAD